MRTNPVGGRSVDRERLRELDDLRADLRARDGHGQHQLSGVIAREAFRMLQDSAWGPRKLYRTTRFDSSAVSTPIPWVRPAQIALRIWSSVAARSPPP